MPKSALPSDAAAKPLEVQPDRGQSLRAQVEHVLNLIRPAVQSDGGDVELVDITAAGVVQVRLHGACVGCPSSTMTLQAGIERNLKERVAGIQAVEAVA